MKLKFNIKPCNDAAEWLKTQLDIKTAWNTCQRGDWMWWALMHLSGAIPSKETSVEFANWCTKRVAANAAYAAYAAYASAVDAAYAACAYAAYAAANAANAADAADAAYAAEQLAQADWIREHCKCPEEEK